MRKQYLEWVHWTMESLTSKTVQVTWRRFTQLLKMEASFYSIEQFGTEVHHRKLKCWPSKLQTREGHHVSRAHFCRTHVAIKWYTHLYDSFEGTVLFSYLNSVTKPVGGT